MQAAAPAKKRQKRGMWAQHTGEARNITPGSRGMLVSCDRGNRKAAMREGIALLQEHVDQTKEDHGASHEDVDKDLEAELATLREDDQKDRSGSLTGRDIGIMGLTFIEWSDDSIPSPVELFVSVMKEAKDRGRLPRMIPFETTCEASVDKIVATAKSLIEASFQSTEKSTFAIAFKARHCDISRVEVIDSVAALVPPSYTVDLTAPQRTIIIECFRKTCGMAIVEGFVAMERGNIRMLADKE